jgi:tetratricopeptide (TPR) repeat protein
MNDRYLYLPLIGFFMGFFLILRGLTTGFLFGNKGWGSRVATFAVVLFLVIPFGELTALRIPEWRSDEALWQAALKRAPRPDSRIYYFSGIQELRSERYDQAIKMLTISNKLAVSADTFQALGVAYASVGNFKEAKDQLNQALKLSPNLVGAFNQLGILYHKENQLEKAKEYFDKALSINPRFVPALSNYALLLKDSGQLDEAILTLDNAVALDPDYATAVWNLSLLYKAKGDIEKANHYYRLFRKLDPSYKSECERVA